MSSADDAPPAATTLPQLDVHRLSRRDASAESVVQLKLTDECISALQKAQRHKLPMRIRIDPQGGGVIELGTPGDAAAETFRFAVQSLPQPHADTLSRDARGEYATRASVAHKYTIQATDKTFAETREKAQKLAEEEKSRGTKDVSRGRRDEKPVTGRMRPAVAPPTTAAARAAANTERLGTSPAAKATSSTSSNASSTGSSGSLPARPNMSKQMQQDLLRRKLRARVIHVVVTARYKTVDDIVRRLTRDGLPPDQSDPREMEQIINEVSEISESGSRRHLKAAFYSEVDQRWAWFTTEERSHVRKIIQGANAVSSSASSFAPTRKTGVDRPQAPSSESRAAAAAAAAAITVTSGATVSPEMVPPAPSSLAPPPPLPLQPPPLPRVVAGGAIVGGAKRVSPKLAQVTAQSTLSTAKAASPSGRILEDLFGAPAQPGKRKAHTPAGGNGGGGSSGEKRPRQESASPPEDPTTTTSSSSSSTTHGTISNSTAHHGHHHNHHHRVAASSSAVSAHAAAKETDHGTAASNSNTTTSGSTSMTSSVSSGRNSAASRLSSPATVLSSSDMSSPPPPHSALPSCDWSKTFPEARRLSQAEKYFALFNEEYPEYMKCYQALNKVQAEFKDLEQQLQTTKGKEQSRIEHTIQRRYMHYEKDPEFRKMRQRHTDLRSKLEVLKSRIDGWERSDRSGGSGQPGKAGPLSAAAINDLFAVS